MRIGSLLFGIIWMYNLFYTILFWEKFIYIILNIIIPFSSIYDLVIKIGEFK